MRIAFLTSRFPYPPHRGDRSTVLSLLRVFSERHRVTLFSLIDGSEPPESVEKVSAFCERIEVQPLSRLRSWGQATLGLFSPLPSQVRYYEHPAFARRIAEQVRGGEFDLIFVHTFRMTPFLPETDAAKVLWLGDSTGHVLGGMASFASWWKRPLIEWERRRVERYAAWSSRRVHESWALTEFDRDDLIRIGCERVVLSAHGVNEQFFAAMPRGNGTPRVGFLGNLSVPHNIDAAVFAAREVWPRIRSKRPDAEFWIVGADPVEAVTQLGEIPGVRVTGTVPDLLPVIEQASVFIAPLRFSTGVQNKVLEPMAAGVPVVTTGPVAQGVRAVHGEHLVIADGAQATADAVLELFRDPAAALRMAERGREHVRRNFSWAVATDRIEHVLEEVRAGRMATRR